MKIAAANNIVLVGMPGAGKSTAGVILAKELCRDFIDTDVLIQTIEKVSLQHIIDTRGYLELRAIEERTIMGVECRNHIIATGGSAVYSEPAMLHLKKNGVIVFLEITFKEILRRISNFATRGLARREDQTLEDLFAERAQLYRKYADITVFSDGKSQKDVVEEIMNNVVQYNF
ncbi:MAG: shikimate kinase [Chitinispirillaceae bacterium]|nr:shikimate kinase [Chitinispirillaceae bacterium]